MQEFVDDAFVGAEADGVAEESGDGAEFAAVGTTASGFDGNDAECAPALAELVQPAGGGFGDEVELLEIDGVPGNHGILLEGGLEFLAGSVDWRVDVLQLTAGGVFDDAGPGVIGFAEGDGIGVARAAIAAEGFVGHFGDVRAAHDDGDTGGANRVSHAISLGDHAGHGADADQVDVVFADVTGDSGFIHGLSVAVDQEHFMARRSQGLQEEHPEMRHEITRNPIVGVIQEDFQLFP